MKLIGSYKITGSLGEGSFGWIYVGEHVILGSNVDVCLKREKTQQEPYIQMFKDEATLLSILRHPSLPAFRDYIEIDTKEGIERFIVLSRIYGDPLDKVLEGGPIDDEHICWITDRFLGALSYIHGRHGLVHCDLKPQNAVLDIDSHEVILLDLGLAASKPDAATIAKGGTPGYLPPEFSLGLPPIPQSDLYSLGKICIAMAGGDIRKGEPPDDMKPELKDFIRALIRRDPMSRPNDVDKLRDDLLKIRQNCFERTITDQPFKRRYEK